MMSLKFGLFRGLGTRANALEHAGALAFSRTGVPTTGELRTG